MKLRELFDTLASGELHNLHLVKNYQVVPDKEQVVLRYINLGLTDLFNRFVLRKDTLVFDRVGLKHGENQGNFFIHDDNLIEVLNVYLDDKVLQFNVDYQMPKVNHIVLRDKPSDLAELKIEYKSKHPTIGLLDLANPDYEISIPSVYTYALALFIASRAYASNVNQLDGDLNEGNRYLKMYHDEIAMLTNQGVDVDSLDSHDWFYERGFV